MTQSSLPESSTTRRRRLPNWSAWRTLLRDLFARRSATLRPARTRRRLCLDPLEFRYALSNIPFAAESILSNTANGAQMALAADLDGDGDQDVIGISAWDDKLTWFENDGAANPTFTSHLISTASNGPRGLSIADVDGDGDLDVLTASRYDNTIAWYENDGSSSPQFTHRVISTSAQSAWSVSTGDVDGDGDLDVLSASADDDKIAWYENDGAADPTFTAHVVSTAANFAFSVKGADLDGDGDLDLLSASAYDDKIAWYENDGAADPTFTERVLSTSAQFAADVDFGDVDGDGDLDVLSASVGDNKIAWYENDGAADPTFTERVVTTSASGAIRVSTADLDGDGDLDLLSASLYDGKIAWYENDGAADPAFTARTISTALAIPRAVAAADLDGDGDLDVVGVSQGDPFITTGTNTFAWFRNDGDYAAPTALWSAIDDSATAVAAATITFAEAVQNVSLADFTLNGTSLSTLSGVGLVVHSASSYSFTGLSTYTGAVGAHTLAVAAGNDIRDLAGNALSGTPSETWHKHLVVVGTEARDLIRLVDAAGDVSVLRRINGRYVETARLQASHAADVQIVVQGLGGDDVIEVRGPVTRRVQLFGGQGNDKLTGGNLDDLLDGGEGNNRIFSGQGNDVVTAGSGNDRIENAGGNDRIDAGDGRNIVETAGGNNMIFTGFGDDRITTGGGNDLIFSGGGNDRLDAGGGNDVLVGGAGDDRLNGGAGRDLVIGGLGADRLNDDEHENLLIAGFTSFDADADALLDLSAEWTSSRTYAQRVQNLSGDTAGPTFGARANENFFLVGDDGPQQTVFDDAAIDTLDGGTDLDWMLAELTGTFTDKRRSVGAGETVGDLDA